MAVLVRAGSVTPRFVANVTLSPSSINPNSLSKETYTVNGLQTDMQVTAIQQAPDADTLRILACRCSLANTLEIMWCNYNSASVSPAASQAVQVVAF